MSRAKSIQSIWRLQADNAFIRELNDGVLLIEHGWAFPVRQPRHVSRADGAVASGTLTSPMPGRVVSIEVNEGDSVSRGQKLVALEAMKMEHSLEAPFDGVVVQLDVGIGSQLEEGAFVLRIEEKGDA